MSCRAGYEGFHPEVRNGGWPRRPECHKWAILNAKPLPNGCGPLSRFSAMLVTDDALHGRGAATSIEDAAVLARALAAVEGDDNRSRVPQLRGDRASAHLAHSGDLQRHTWMSGGNDNPDCFTARCLDGAARKTEMRRLTRKQNKSRADNRERMAS